MIGSASCLNMRKEGIKISEPDPSSAMIGSRVSHSTPGSDVHWSPALHRQVLSAMMTRHLLVRRQPASPSLVESSCVLTVLVVSLPVFPFYRVQQRSLPRRQRGLLDSVALEFDYQRFLEALEVFLPPGPDLRVLTHVPRDTQLV